MWSRASRTEEAPAPRAEGRGYAFGDVREGELAPPHERALPAEELLFTYAQLRGVGGRHTRTTPPLSCGFTSLSQLVSRKGERLAPQLVARWTPSRYIWGPGTLHPVARNRRHPFFNHKVQESVFLCVEVWGLL